MLTDALPSEILILVLAQLCVVRDIKGTKRTCRAFRDAAPEAEKAVRRLIFEHAEPVRCVAAVPDGRVITGSDDKTVKVWRDGACERTIQADTDHAWAVAMWRTCREERLRRRPRASRELIEGRTRIVEAPDTSCAVCGDGEDEAGNEILLCDGCEAGYHLQCLTPPLAAIPEGDWFCPACDGTAKLWTMDGAIERIFAMGVPVVCVAAMADDVHFVVGLGGGGPSSGEVRLYHVDGTLVHAFTGHTDAVTTVTATPEGQHIISGSRDKTARIAYHGFEFGKKDEAAIPVYKERIFNGMDLD